MNFRFFTGLGRAAFSQFKKVPMQAPSKSGFMKKMSQTEIVSMVARSALPITSAGLLMQNLTRLLEKKENTITQIESALGALLGVHSEQGTVTLDRILMDWVLRYLVIIAGVQLTMSNTSKILSAHTTM